MQYKIQHRIKTLAQLWEPFEHKGFRFEQWDFSFAEGCKGDAWVAIKTVDAGNATEAINAFRTELFPIVDRIAFVSQCFTSVELQSFSIAKEDYAEHVFFLRHSIEVPPVPLHFAAEERESLASLENFVEKGDVFGALREAGNASTFWTRLSRLTSALEAIAGEKTVGRRIETDKDFIRTQLLKNDDLYRDLFDYGTGVRNKLQHGGKVSLQRERNYINDIYKSIVRFFNEKHGTKINQGVVSPQRHFFGNYEATNMWLKPAQPPVPPLRILVDDATSLKERDHGEFWQKYTSVEMPPDY